MTSLQNGNYNSRSMNGLTSIYANDITCDTIETTDATITNNLSVGNGLSVNGVSTFNNDLIIYDKGSPVYPYRFRTIGRRLVLQYDNPTTRTYFDCSFNAFGSPQLWFPNQIVCNFSAFFNSDLYIADTKRIFLGDITGSNASQFQYSQTTKTLTITSGFGGGTGSNMTFQTNNAAGAPFQIQFNPTQLSIPVSILMASNTDLTQQGTGKIVQSATAGTNTLGAITMNSNADITQQGTGKIVQSGTAGTNTLGAITMNSNADLTQQGTGKIVQSGTAGTNTLGAITMNSNADITQQGTGIIVQSATAGVNTLGAITMNSNADITQQGTGKIVQSATAGTNTMGAITLNSNRDLTQQGTGKIVQSATAGTNTMGAITMNAGTTLTQSTTGVITQSGTGTNTLKGTTLLANTDLTFQIGSGRINQSSNTSVNLMSAITMNNANNLTYQDTTVQRTAFTESVLNECEIHSWVNGTTLPILFSTFNLGNATNAALAGVGQFSYHFIAVKLITNQVYNGIGMYCGTAAAAAWECALYARGTTPARLATSGIQGSVANTMNYFSFASPYTYTGATGIAYVAWRTTAAAQTILFLPVNNFLNYNKTTFTNGRLDKRTQVGTVASNIAFPATLGAGLVMSTLNSYAYVVLY